MLFSSRLTIKEESDRMWGSVFWNDDNYRPDKTTKTLNSIYQKLDNESRTRMTDAFENNAKAGLGAETSFMKLFTARADLKAEYSSQESKLTEDVARLYQERRDDVHWGGEKFAPKPLSLARINLSKLRDRQSLKDRSVRVRYSTAVLSTPINFADDDRPLVSYWAGLLNSAVDQLKKELNISIDFKKINLDNVVIIWVILCSETNRGDPYDA